MNLENLKIKIENIWEQKDHINDTSNPEEKRIVDQVLDALDKGAIRVSEKKDGQWVVHDWIKKAILLAFRLYPFHEIPGGPGGFNLPSAIWYDRIPNKFSGWTKNQFEQAKIRAVPSAIVRYGAFIDKNVVLMPSFVNIGAFVGDGTMVDTWATVGSCAQIGKHCHISGGAGIGGVIEPLNARPTIIEDRCFIGARSEIAEGVIVEEGCVISMGVFISASTKIVHRQTGEVFQGRVPAYSVVVPGTLPGTTPTSPHLACAVIVKNVDEKTRSKTSLNDLLRDIE